MDNAWPPSEMTLYVPSTLWMVPKVICKLKKKKKKKKKESLFSGIELPRTTLRRFYRDLGLERGALAFIGQRIPIYLPSNNFLDPIPYPNGALGQA